MTTWSPGFTVRTSLPTASTIAGRLVAGDAGQRMRIGALDEVQVGMAQAAGGGADPDLARAGVVEPRLARW